MEPPWFIHVILCVSALGAFILNSLTINDKGVMHARNLQVIVKQVYQRIVETNGKVIFT